MLPLPSYGPRQHPSTQFFTVRMPFLSPNQQCQSTEGLQTPNWRHYVFDLFVCLCVCVCLEGAFSDGLPSSSVLMLVMWHVRCVLRSPSICVLCRLTCVPVCKGKGEGKRNIAVGNYPHCYGNSHTIWDHTVLPAAWQRWRSHPYIYAGGVACWAVHPCECLSACPSAPCRLRGIMRPWFNFWFWRYTYCLLVNITCLPIYPLFLTFPHLSPPLLIFSFENRPAPFPGQIVVKGD